MLLVHINWEDEGALSFAPQSVQAVILKQLGTNPRGAELSSEAAQIITKDKDAARIDISWAR